MLSLKSPSQDVLCQAFTDITAPQHGVEVVTDSRNGIVWINVDGVCLLRICQIPLLLVENCNAFK